MNYVVLGKFVLIIYSKILLVDESHNTGWCLSFLLYFSEQGGRQCVGLVMAISSFFLGGGEGWLVVYLFSLYISQRWWGRDVCWDGKL